MSLSNEITTLEPGTRVINVDVNIRGVVISVLDSFIIVKEETMPGFFYVRKVNNDVFMKKYIIVD